MKPETADSATIVIGLVLLGRWLEGEGPDAGAIRHLGGLGAKTARVVGEDGEGAISTWPRSGRAISSAFGRAIPVGSIVVEEASAIDRSMLTGKPIPRGRR
jgi:cation transport ATPase